MNSIVANVLMRQAAETRTDVSFIWTIGLLCGAGLLASFCMAIVGLDLGAGFF
jgi:hypothetical protein